MQIRTGFELVYSFPQATPLILVVNIHDSRASDMVVPDLLMTDPFLSLSGYRDKYGNWCYRGLAPAGRVRLSTDCVIRDNGQPDERIFTTADPATSLRR